MQYHEQGWEKRFGTLGDWAEEAFEQIAPLGRWLRFGWNRPHYANGVRARIGHMSDKLRHKPDYICGSTLVECVGLGRDGVLKLQSNKHDAVARWADDPDLHESVVWFFWNSNLSEYALVPHDRVSAFFGPEQSFHDGNKYHPVNWQDLAEAGLVVSYHGG